MRDLLWHAGTLGLIYGTPALALGAIVLGILWICGWGAPWLPWVALACAVSAAALLVYLVTIFRHLSSM